MRSNKRRAVLSGLVVCALFVLCGVLGALQYRWIGEVSAASRERLQGSLEATLRRLSRDFNAEIAAACRSLMPAALQPNVQAAEVELVARYQGWQNSFQHPRIFSRIALAVPQGNSVGLRALNPMTGVLEPAAWPAHWSAIRNRLELRLWRAGRPNRPLLPRTEEGLIFEFPLFQPEPPVPRHMSFLRRETAWVIFEFDPQYIREAILPELLLRHLGSGGKLDYQIEVVTRSRVPEVIFQSDPGQQGSIAPHADASVGLFELPLEQVLRHRAGPGGRNRGFGPTAADRGPPLNMGRWQLFVRHRAGSLEALVAQARVRNLAVTGCVLLLMAASVAALIRYTRRAQKLAEVQMEFVAGVSHELRTPLTVIHTAAYNLQGKIAHNPAQVERYGALIQQESGRLKALVEQVLLFAGMKAGVNLKPEPLSVESMIDATIESSKAVLEEAHCTLEKAIEPGLPLILGDRVALQHVLQNLLANAAKYGSNGSTWIGVFASKATDDHGSAVEIRVADRGPGIPEDEREHIFDPFFRGRHAIENQVHGTGLGLNLAKRIVEAHGGNICVRSELMKGTEFIVRIPTATAGARQ